MSYPDHYSAVCLFGSGGIVLWLLNRLQREVMTASAMRRT